MGVGQVSLGEFSLFVNQFSIFQIRKKKTDVTEIAGGPPADVPSFFLVVEPKRSLWRGQCLQPLHLPVTL